MKRPRRPLFLGGGVVASALAWGACGPVSPPPPSPIPQNTCPCGGADAGPGGATCVGGVCRLAAAIDPVLVFDFTEAASFGATLQYAVRYSDLAAASSKSPLTCASPTALCAVVPGALSEDGFYAVNAFMQARVEDPIAAAGDTTNITVPVQVEYRPQWTFGSAKPPVYVDASYLGLPLRTIQAARVSPAALHGPFGADPVGWQGGFFAGVYQRYVTPDTPFDAAYPPLLIPPDTFATNSRYERPVQDVDAPAGENRSLTVARNGSDPSLDGWTVHVRDRATSSRISQLTTLRGSAPPAFQVDTVGQATLGNQLLVVTPAPGIGPLPTLVDNVPPVGFLKAEAYPALPPPAVVSGSVRGPNSERVDADVLFVDAGGPLGAIVTLDPSDPTRPFLRYEARVRASGGAFTALLPPGEYNVFVIPDVETTLAATRSTQTIPVAAVLDSSSASGLDASAPAPLDAGSEGGVTGPVSLVLTAGPRVGVRGIAQSPGGRPLAGATVEARPSVWLLGRDDRRSPTAQSSVLLTSAAAAEIWPRGQTTFTDDTGAYALALDPGVYDLFIEPAPGSGFPWAILPARSIAGDRVDLGTAAVPYPNVLSLQVRSSNRDSVAAVLVRAYLPVPSLFLPAADPSATARSDGSESPLVEVGSALTDSDGLVQLSLTSPN